MYTSGNFLSNALQSLVFIVTGFVGKVIISQKTELICSNGQEGLSKGDGDKTKRNHEGDIRIMRVAQGARGADTTDEIIKEIALRVWKGVERVVDGSGNGRVSRKVNAVVTRLR